MTDRAGPATSSCSRTLNIKTRRSLADNEFVRGFTLFELAMVLAIAALIAGIALPRFGGTLSRYRVQAAAERVMSDMRLAQQEAVRSSKAQRMEFDITQHSYTLPGVQDPMRPTKSYVVRLSSDPYRARLAYADFAGKPFAEFDGYGQLVSEGMVTIEVSGRFLEVVLESSSGKAVIK